MRVKRKRDRVANFFVNRQPTLVAMEACGGTHHWGQVLQAQGYKVKLLPAKQVRPFVLRHKTDACDAQGIWDVAQQLHIRAIALKTVRQQFCLCLHQQAVYKTVARLKLYKLKNLLSVRRPHKSSS